MKKEFFLILIIVCFFTHIIRTFYEVLKHKKKLKPNKLSFIIMFINMVLLWMSWFALCNLDIHKIAMPPVIRYAGISLVGLGVLVFLIALITIKSLESYEGDLITHGIYSKIRHPMYLAFILWLTGMPLFYGGLISLAMAFVLIANVIFWRYLEEIELEHRFATYWEYKKTTLF
jgi:protein-S-isoprenylcysteine O-methyltransferase Ste14